MPPRRAIEVRHAADDAAPKWRMSLLESPFTAFPQSPAAAKAVFAEGSLFSPYLFGKFFDPADAFPLWEFESDVLLAALRRAARTAVDWAETDSEYSLRADIPDPAAAADVAVGCDYYADDPAPTTELPGAGVQEPGDFYYVEIPDDQDQE